MSYKDEPQNPCSKEDGILIVVRTWIFSQEIRALIDSGTTRCFISSDGVTKCGLNVESHNNFLELGDGKKVLSWGRAVNVFTVTSGYAFKTDLTVSNLLHSVDAVLGMTWLEEADPLIRWILVLFTDQTPYHFFRGLWVNDWTSKSRPGLWKYSQWTSSWNLWGKPLILLHWEFWNPQNSGQWRLHKYKTLGGVLTPREMHWLRNFWIASSQLRCSENTENEQQCCTVKQEYGWSSWVWSVCFRKLYNDRKGQGTSIG